MKKLIVLIALIAVPGLLWAQKGSEKGFINDFHVGSGFVLGKNNTKYTLSTMGVSFGYAFNKTFALSGLIEGDLGMYGDNEGAYIGNLALGAKLDVDFTQWIGAYGAVGSTVIKTPYNYMYGEVGVKLLDNDLSGFFCVPSIGLRYQHSYKAAFDNHLMLNLRLEFPLFWGYGRNR